MKLSHCLAALTGLALPTTTIAAEPSPLAEIAPFPKALVQSVWVQPI
jgi:hypothetical protein